MNQESRPSPSPSETPQPGPARNGDAGPYQVPPAEQVLRPAEAEEAPQGRRTIRLNGARPAGGPGGEPVTPPPNPLTAEDEDQADLTADIYPAIPGGQKRGLQLPGGGGRISIAELEGHQIRKGLHPGDRVVRRSRPTEEGFRRVGPGHLEALPRTLEPTTGLGRIFGTLKRVLIGTPLSTAAAAHERLTKVKALAVLSSDALSSVTYATEAILGVLLLAGSRAFSYNIPIAIAIAALIAIVVFSYRQTIYAYPKGGGSYIVSKDNLGTLPGLVAGASLLTGYVLTVAVSISAGVANLISLVATMQLGDLTNMRVIVALLATLILVLLNLRGIRESGTIFSAPTYIFLALMFGMIALGLYQYFIAGTLGHVTNVPDPVTPGAGGVLESVGLFLLLRAFAAGCAALTGIEAISDGVPAFQKPESKNAALTLVILGSLLAVMFLGISFLADHVEVQISHTETVVSQLGRTIFGTGPIYTLFLIFTALLLVLAANTAFADFPRLSFFLARDRFLPHQFQFRGDRLAFTFGIVTLGVLSGLLIAVFGGSTEGLLPLYAIGVFTSFTLSQSSMVMRWWRKRPSGWQLSLAVNALGALTTLVVTLILAVTRFGEGAWMVMIIVPLLVLMLLRIHSHYDRVGKILSLTNVDPRVGKAAAQGATFQSHPLINIPNEGTQAGIVAQEGETLKRIEHLVVMPVASLNQVTLRTLAYARSITDNVVVVHVAADEEPEATEQFEAHWHDWIPDVPLVIVDSPYRSLLRPLLSYIDALHRQQPERVLTVLIPEFVASRWWEHLLHNQSALRLKGSLLFRPGIVVISVPYHIPTRAEAVL